MPETTYSQSVAAEVRAELARQQRHGLDLAKHLGMKQSTLSRRLTGDIAFDLDQIAAVADWLAVDLDHLIDIRAAQGTTTDAA